MTNYVALTPSTAEYCLAVCWIATLLVILALSSLGRRRNVPGDSARGEPTPPRPVAARQAPDPQAPVRSPAAGRKPSQLTMARTPEARQAQLAARAARRQLAKPARKDEA